MMMKIVVRENTNMDFKKVFFSTNRKIDLLLLVSSFIIYFFHFHPIFLNINSTLSSITLDSLKNYYTFVYHIKNDVKLLDFTGLNYPFGEHIVYTDCQPLFSFVLRLLPFTHGHLIGILHSMMFLSFIISPLIVVRIFRLLKVDAFSSFFISLAICLLSPQFLKINAGHFALAYGCVFPLSMLFLLQFIKNKGRNNLVVLFLYNTLLFFLHPYLGICSALFSLLAIVLMMLLEFNRKTLLAQLVSVFVSSLLPILIFKLFIFVSDHHVNRTTEPFGAFLMVENMDSVLAPVFGPFQQFLGSLFPNKTTHYEGHTYLGFFTILLTLLSILALPFIRKKIELSKGLLAIFLSAFIILLISFGMHLQLFTYLGISSSALNQFRAVCRFAWLFYYVLPIFIVTVLYHSLKNYIHIHLFRRWFALVSILFFIFNLTEAHYFFKLDENSYWKFRNFFHADYLNSEEQNNLKLIKEKRPQAILPLPIYHGGSEMYDRLGSNNSMIPSMIYSYHSNTPILSVMLSRTSLTETKDLIQTLNSYKNNKSIETHFSSAPFFVILTQDEKLPDEDRLINAISFDGTNDSLKFAFITKEELLSKKTGNELIELNKTELNLLDTSSIVFIETKSTKPFIESTIENYETIYVLDSNRIKSGKYIVSFHYYYTHKTYQALACGLIITRSNSESSEWQYTIPVRYLSGFYPGYGVFEYSIDLGRENKYEFILKGDQNDNYFISHFLLRPKKCNTLFVTTSKDTLYNNYQY